MVSNSRNGKILKILLISLIADCWQLAAFYLIISTTLSHT